MRAPWMLLAVSLIGLPSLGRAFGAAGTVSSPYLELPMGARGEGMGEAFTGIADDDEAMFYNVAGLTQLDAAHLLLMHDDSFGGVRYEHLAFAVPAEKVGLDLWGTVGFSYTLVSIENIPRTRALPDGSYDQAYANLGYYFTSGDSNFNLSYAWQATKLYSIGAQIKFLNEKVDTSNGWGVAGDLGLFTNVDDFVKGLSAGVTVQNIGTSPTPGAPLPVGLRVGLGYKIAHPFTDPDENNDKMVMGLDFIMPIVPVDGTPGVNFGTEYSHWFGDVSTALRVGYRFPTDLGALAGLSAGGSLTLQSGGNDFGLDYSFVPYGILGISNRIALNVFFGEKPHVSGPRASGPLVVPSGLKAKAGDQSAFLTWDASPVRVTGYNVYMSYNPSSGQWYRVKSHDNHATTVNKLYNGYNIYFAVSSIRRKSDGTWEESAKSEPVLVKPVAPGAAAQAKPAAAKPTASQKQSQPAPAQRKKPAVAPMEPPPLP
jgi:hypothetical protein